MSYKSPITVHYLILSYRGQIGILTNFTWGRYGIITAGFGLRTVRVRRSLNLTVSCTNSSVRTSILERVLHFARTKPNVPKPNVPNPTQKFVLLNQFHFDLFNPDFCIYHCNSTLVLSLIY